jgi:hypothetical protein
MKIDPILEQCTKELDYILTSTTSSPSTYSRHKLADSIVKTLKGRQVSGSPSAILQETIHYRLSKILKEVTTWHDFVRRVKEEIPEYRNHARLLLRRSRNENVGLGGFIWRHQFQIPPIRTYSRRKEKQLQLSRVEAAVPTDLASDLESLRNRVRALESAIEFVLNVIKKHKLHIVPMELEIPNLDSEVSCCMCAQLESTE